MHPLSTCNGPYLQLSKLESLAIYFDTDAESMAGLTHADFIKKFTEQVRISPWYRALLLNGS